MRRPQNLKPYSKKFWHYLKGQLILKGRFGILEFFQKTNERIRFLVLLGKKPNSFVRFMEESLAWKKHYDFVWHLTCNYRFVSDIFDWILHRSYSWHEKSWRMAKLSHDPRNSLSNDSFCRGSLRINESLRTNCQWGLDSFQNLNCRFQIRSTLTAV